MGKRLTDFQARALLSLKHSPGHLREPTAAALERMGLVHRPPHPKGWANCEPVELTAKGRNIVKSIEDAKELEPHEPDLYENWESYT